MYSWQQYCVYEGHLDQDEMWREKEISLHDVCGQIPDRKVGVYLICNFDVSNIWYLFVIKLFT
jgi:hypothetical protein